MINFHEQLVAKTMETIKDAADLFDVRTDLQRIDDAWNGIRLLGDTVTARNLDAELRQKYPVINEMLAFANTLCSPFQQTPMRVNQTEANQEQIALKQDHYGILCHVALEKGICQSIRHFIKSVD